MNIVLAIAACTFSGSILSWCCQNLAERPLHQSCAHHNVGLATVLALFVLA